MPHALLEGHRLTQQQPSPNAPHAAWERGLIACTLAVLGAITGVVTVWAVTNLPGIDVATWIYIFAGIASAAVCFVSGLRSSDATVDALGSVWKVVWRLSRGILKIVRALYRQ